MPGETRRRMSAESVSARRSFTDARPPLFCPTFLALDLSSNFRPGLVRRGLPGSTHVLHLQPSATWQCVHRRRATRNGGLLLHRQSHCNRLHQGTHGLQTLTTSLEPSNSMKAAINWRQRGQEGSGAFWLRSRCRGPADITTTP